MKNFLGFLLIIILIGVLSLIFLKRNKNIVYKPAELFASEAECVPHAKQGVCLESKCTKGESNGSRYSDGSPRICGETWSGWVPVNLEITKAI